MSTPRLTTSDLEFAIHWCDNYEGDADDDNVARAERFIAWGEAELARRAETATARKVAAKLAAEGRPVSLARARTAVRNALANQESQ